MGRITASVVAVLALGTTVACDDDGVSPRPIEPPEFFTAFLVGEDEVPPVETDAFGIAEFEWVGNEILYCVEIFNITDLTAGHIHVGDAGENGPVVVSLFEEAPPVSSADFVVEALFNETDAGEEIDDLLDLMRDGETYVNAHTVQNPGGEIRGQVQQAPQAPGLCGESP